MLKAIETEYKGYLFRSRLEARWAVFFDTLGIEYEYEPEGFELGDGMRYLPDFWLPGLEWWIEVKHGNYKESIKTDKAHLFAEQTGERIYTFFGMVNPSDSEFSRFGWDYPDSGRDGWAIAYFGGHGYDLPYFFCECPYCHAIGIEYAGFSQRIKHAPGCTDENIEWGRGQNANAQRIMAAYKAARHARFEHGHKGRMR